MHVPGRVCIWTALREDLLNGCGTSADNWGEGGFPSGRRWSLLTWVLGTLAWSDCPFLVMSQSYGQTVIELLTWLSVKLLPVPGCTGSRLQSCKPAHRHGLRSVPASIVWHGVGIYCCMVCCLMCLCLTAGRGWTHAGRCLYKPTQALSVRYGGFEIFGIRHYTNVAWRHTGTASYPLERQALIGHLSSKRYPTFKPAPSRL